MSGPPDGIPLPVPSLKPLTLWLRRFSPSGPRKGAVLLTHGGNSAGDTFLLPSGGLKEVLVARGWDVWVLEWRGSPYVMEEVLALEPFGGSVSAERRVFTFDQVAVEDFPAALHHVRGETPNRLPIVIVAHCLSSGIAALACARGYLEPFGIRKIVLCELGLFVAVPWNGWLKPEDFILERLIHDSPACRAISPKRREEWPPTFELAAQAWPSAWLPSAGMTSWERMLHDLSFMAGQPYTLDRLNESLREGAIEPYFGPMHLGLYLHAAQSVRRGYLARFDAPDAIDRVRMLPLFSVAPAVSAPPTDDLNPEFFRDKSFALIAAGNSRVWHRDAIDMMYDWLRRIGGRDPSTRVTKHVFADYGLQELFWGRQAPDQVYPVIAEEVEI